ncbi:unnamed protein product [Scytosiphon promiscuus]
MRLIKTTAAFCIGIVVSAKDITGSAASLRQLDAQNEVPTVGVADASLEEATRRHDLDIREDLPLEGAPCTPSPLWAKEVDPAKYEIGCKEIEELLRGNKTFAGRGNIREVYIAQYKGRRVAVKLLINSSEVGKHEHWLEMVATDAVKGKPHVVDMLGFCDSTVVTEAYSKNAQMVVHRAKKDPLPIRRVVSMSLDAAIGLRALHEAAGGPIVHFDVKLGQLLVQDNGRVRLGDYNLAYFMGKAPDGSPCAFNKKSPERSPNGRKSPEYASREPLTEKVDIYRMGLVFADLLSAGRGPLYASWAGDAPSFDPAWHEGYVKVVEDMIGEVERRPSATELVSRLQSIEEEIYGTSYLGQDGT